MFGWLKKIYHLLEGKDQELQVRFNEEIPNDIKEDKIYIIGTKEYPWLALFLCPCGCKQIIQLNLLSKKRPCWKFKLNKNGISLSPSVWRTKGCRSHFIVRNSQVIWVFEFDE